MLNKKILPITLAFFLVTGLVAYSAEKPSETKEVAMPDNVKTIIENSCFGCHNTDSKNDKAKEALDLKTMGELSKSKMIHALREINEVVEENEMPPEKFLAKYPDKKLSEEDKKVLMEWAKSEAKALME
jgi:hypothetical protein